MSVQSNDTHIYTTGGDPTLLHRDLVGRGAFGAVHEVNRITSRH